MLRHYVLLTIIACIATPAIADGDPVNGKVLIKKWYCIDCHGLTGNTRSTRTREVPMLAGQPAVFLAKRLAEYKSGKHDGLVDWSRMGTLVQGLSEDDMNDIAAYYEAQKRY
jgi:cytochrome c553